MSEDTQQLPTLPPDVITEILSRLPVKSLCKFRCVSKPWNSLLRSQRFTKLHLSRALENLSQQSILCSVNPFVSIKYDGVDDFVKDDVSNFNDGLDETLIQWTRAHPVMASAGDKRDYYVVGECHGLVCVVVTKSGGYSHLPEKTVRTICLWNPSIGDCRELCRDDVVSVSIDGDKRCIFNNEHGDTIRFDVYGFGYDLVVDDYKVVRMVCYESCKDALEVKIYSIGSKTWRKMEVQLSVWIRVHPGWFTPYCSLVNGSCHWIAYTMDDPRAKEPVILSFNMESEKLDKQVVPLPASKLHYLSLELTVVNGQLCLTTLPGPTDLWVMTKYGERASWTKMANLGGDTEPIPICFTRKGNILVCESDKLRMVDPKTNAHIGGHFHRLPMGSQPVMFTKSLVSPHHIPNADGNLIRAKPETKME